MEKYVESAMENLCLKGDYDAEISFRGRLFSECSYFDEDTRAITRQRLYVTDQGEQVYAIVSGLGGQKESRVYKLKLEGDHCIIHNGRSEIVLGTEMLLTCVRGLCGLDETGSASLLASLEETLKAANI